MKAAPLRFFTILVLLALFSACANIVPPSGGKKDTTPPKMVELYPADSQLNKKVSRIDMRFDEFVTVSDIGKEIKISPLIPFPLSAVVTGKKLTVKIPDSLLKENTTYRINFGSAIKDLNEGNVFKDFNYIFSTGDYFDSLKIYGKVYDAATGQPASDINVILYDTSSGDSAVVRQKPLYITRSRANGAFTIPGLPANTYRIYALKDDDENLIYGGENELIGFIDSVIIPVDSVDLTKPVELRIFKEVIPVDSLYADDTAKRDRGSIRNRVARRRGNNDNTEFNYTVGVDTTNVEKRVHDVNKPIRIQFSNILDTFDERRVFLSYDSLGADVEADFSLIRDTTPDALLLNTAWKENTVYTIRLLKSFATDTAKVEAFPSKYIFRTKDDEDYGVIVIHVALKYYGEKYVMKIMSDKDTVYRKPITDSTITIRKLVPGKYSLMIIVDENGNGKWDTGDLFAKRQPELVIPYTETVELRAGWENVLDYKEPVTEDPNAKMKPKVGRNTPPVKGDTPGNK